MCILTNRARGAGRQHRLVLAVLAATALSLSQARMAAADAGIFVDASSIVQLCAGVGCDDLKTLQNIYQGANVPAEPAMGTALSALSARIAELKIKRLRMLQGDNLCDLDANGNLGSVGIAANPDGSAVRNLDGSFVFTPVTSGGCNLIDWTMPWMLNNGLSVHAAVGSFMPPSFIGRTPAPPYDGAENWSAATLALYKTYADRLVRFIVTRAFDNGAPSVIFEVSNELDIADGSPQTFDKKNPANNKLAPLGPWERWLWWIDPASFDVHGWPGMPGSYPYETDKRRVEHAISPIQKIYADVIKTVRDELAVSGTYPGKTIEIAGPAFSSAGFNWYPLHGQQTLEEDFLDQMLSPTALSGRFNAPLDRFSFHYYGDFQNGFGWDPGAGPKTTLKFVTDTVKAKLTALGKPNTPLFLTEWGPSAIGANINYTHTGAAWAAAFLTEAVADGITAGSYLILSDAVGGAADGDLTMQSMMHKLTDASGGVYYYPKPVANVFKMFNMMTGTRNAVSVSPTGTASNLGAFVTSDANSASVLVYNYSSSVFNDKASSTVETPENFTINVGNLWGSQAYTGLVTVKRYVIDANTSNLYAFLKPDGTHPSPELQLVDQTTGFVSDNQLSISSGSPLGLGVVLYRIERQSP